jgi:integrase
MIQQGQVFKLKAKSADGQPLWAYRYRVEGRASLRPQVGGFATRDEAQKALRKALDRIGPGRGGAITLAELVEEYLELHQAEPVTIDKLRWLLRKATASLGDKRIADLSPKDVYAWRSTLPEGHRFEATQALRQVLNRAVAWGLIDFNPAKRGVPNPQRRPKEKRPFESWSQLEAVAARLGPVYGPMVIFAAATGLRPSELFGLEQHDVDREAGDVYMRRAFANGRIKHTKTRLSTRAVPLQAKAVEALDRLPASANPILFPNGRGGRIDFQIFGRKHWRPVQIKAGIEPVRGLYDLRHTYATFALRAGVPVFAVSRFIGSSIAMIDLHYGHLAHDSREHAVALMDALALERAVDAAWTSTETLQSRSATAIRGALGGGNSGAWTLGGRRGSFSSPLPTTKTADQQERCKAPSRTRTVDPLLTMNRCRGLPPVADRPV